MKKIFLALCITLFFLPELTFSQKGNISDSLKAAVQQKIDLINQTIKEKGYRWTAGVTSKSYLSEKEMKHLCGLHSDTTNLQKRLQEENKMYQQYKAQQKEGLYKTQTVPPNWIGWMGKVKSQECGNCWAHAAAGTAIGVLQYYYGSNVEIGLNEMDITNNASCGDCGGTYYLNCGLSYIYTNKVQSQQGINQFPSYDHGYYTVSSYSSNTASIVAIKASLQNSPVNAAMDVYEDFANYTGGIYQHTSGSFIGGHAVVIVGYDDANQCWICKNSWGTGWGERENEQPVFDDQPVVLNGDTVKGYFRIAYGQCEIDSWGNVTASVTSSSCFAKIVPNFQTFSNAMGSSWVINEWAYVLSSPSISSGSTVNVPSGAYITFQNGSSLIVNGTLNAQGTSASNITFNFVSPGSTQNGIVINQGGTATISNAIIENAQIGIEVNQTYASIQNTQFQNCDGFTIYLNNTNYAGSQPVINYNTLTGISGFDGGIYLYYSSPNLDKPEPKREKKIIFA